MFWTFQTTRIPEQLVLLRLRPKSKTSSTPTFSKLLLFLPLARALLARCFSFSTKNAQQATTTSPPSVRSSPRLGTAPRSATATGSGATTTTILLFASASVTSGNKLKYNKTIKPGFLRSRFTFYASHCTVALREVTHGASLADSLRLVAALAHAFPS